MNCSPSVADGPNREYTSPRMRRSGFDPQPSRSLATERRYLPRCVDCFDRWRCESTTPSGNELKLYGSEGNLLP